MKKHYLKKMTVALLGASLFTIPTVPLQAQELTTQQIAERERVEDFQPTKLADEPLDPLAEVVSINGDDLTLQQLVMIARLRRMDHLWRQFAPVQMLPRLRGEDLEYVSKFLGAWDIIGQDAKEKGVELNEESKEVLENQIKGTRDARLYQIVVTEKLEEATDEKLEEVYEEYKDTRFTKKEEMKMRHIFVSTYEEYEVKEGDSLESIASEISGDAEMADRIMSQKFKKPRHEVTEYITDEGEKIELEPRALLEGEILMVPSSGEIVEKAEAKINEAVAALEEGKTFEEVAKEYSENERPGRLWVIRPEDEERQIMSELQDAFLALEDGEYSEPLRTKHGFQIVYRESYEPGGPTPMDEVKGALNDIYISQQREQLVKDFFASVMKDSEATSIDLEGMLEDGEDASEDDVLVKIGEKEFTREALNNKVKEGSLLELAENGEDRVVERLTELADIQRAIIDVYSKESNLNADPVVKMMERYIENTLLTVNFMDQEMERLFGNPSEEEIEKHYEETKDSRRQPERYTLYVAEIDVKSDEDGDRNAEEALERLAEETRSVQSLAEFQEIADTINKELERPTVKAQGLVGTIPTSTLTQSVIDELEKVEVPGMTEPFLRTPSKAVVYWAEEYFEERVPSLDEIREDVVESYKAVKSRAYRDRYIADVAETVDVTILEAALANEDSSEDTE